MNSMLRPRVCLQLLQQVQDLRLDRDVERRDRLVGDQELRLDGQRPGDPDPLPLPAGELVRVAPGMVGMQADQLEQLADPRAPGGTFGELVGIERLAEDAGDRHPRVEARERVLEDDLHPAAQGQHLAATQPAELDAVERDPAGRRLDQPQHAAAGGGLAGAGFADQARRSCGAAP